MGNCSSLKQTFECDGLSIRGSINRSLSTRVRMYYIEGIVTRDHIPILSQQCRSDYGLS
jgi:hypothetical protein